MKRKLTFAVTAVALAVMMVIGGTLAWFTDSKTVTNKASFRSVGINLDETYTKTTNATEVTKPTDVEKVKTITEWLPGDTLNKVPVVTNVGTTPLLLKVTVTYSGDQFHPEIPEVEENSVSPSPDTKVAQGENLVTKDEIISAFKNQASKDWEVNDVECTDSKVVAYKLTPLAKAGEAGATANVFELKKTFDGNKYDNDIAQASFSIEVKVEGIQVDNIVKDDFYKTDASGAKIFDIQKLKTVFDSNTIKVAKTIK